MEKKTREEHERPRDFIWVHGCALLTEASATTITRLETAASISPASFATLSYPHFIQVTVPVPSILDNRHVHVVKAFLRFRTGDSAQITQIRLYDAETLFAAFSGPFKSNHYRDLALGIKHPHRVHHGVAFSIEVSFHERPGPRENWVEIASAGVELVRDECIPREFHHPADQEVEER